MGKLSGLDYEQILVALSEIHSISDPNGFSRQLLAILFQLVKADSVAVTEVDPVFGKSAVCYHPPDLQGWTGIEERFQRNIADHPVIAEIERTRDGSAKAISDFLTAGQFESTGLYREVFAPMGLTDQLSISIVGSAGLMIGISFNRSRRGFSSRDRAILNALRPHILQAYLNCRERRETRNQTNDRHSSIINQLPLGLICVDAGGRIVWSTATAKQMLQADYPDASESIHGLPDSVRRWLKRVSTAPPRSRAKKAAQLVSRSGDRELRIRYCPLEDRRGILLFQEVTLRSESQAMAEYGFTDRERQVAQQIISGKPVQTIAKTLGVSPRTLQKHLERVFRKLHVKNLASACVKLLQRN